MSNLTHETATADMAPESRACRTWLVINLDDAQLLSLHEREKEVRRFLLGFEIKNRFFSDLRSGFPTTKRLDKSFVATCNYNKQCVNALISFNNQHRPDTFGTNPFDSESTDVEFDGMRYHHAWDECVRFFVPQMPQPENFEPKAEKKA